MKKLYHGSIYSFDSIDIHMGRGYKDFGKGFYATAIPSHAERIAIRNKHIEERRQAAIHKKNSEIKLFPVTAYRYNLLHTEEPNGLRIKVFHEADVDWLRFILKNRHSPVSVHDYDIVIGPTADAETNMILNDYAEDLERSNYSDEICEEVIKALKPENLPKQYFFGTEEAIKTLSFDRIRRQIIQ